MDERRVKVMSDASRVRPARTQSRHDTSLRFRNVTFWTLSLIASSTGAYPDRRKPFHHNSLQWWAHLDSNQGPDGMRRPTSVAGYPIRIPKTNILRAQQAHGGGRP